MPDNDGLKIVVSLDIKKCIERINADLIKIEKQIKELEIKATLNKGESLKNINQQINELNRQKQDLTAELKLNTEKLEKQYSDIQRKNDMSVNVETSKASKQIAVIGGNISNVNNQTMELADSLKGAFANMGLALSTESIFRAIKKLASEATEAVKEYDRMSTNLKIITGKSDVSDMIADYADKSISMGIDVSDYEKSAEVILRAGKSVEESNQFIEKSLQLSKTGFIDAESSAENLLVISNAYDITADKLENVTDALLTLDTATNTEAGALSEAMAKAAANSQLAGLSYEKLGAMIAKLKDSTGKSESELATSLNQILNRTYRVKPNAYIFENENGETEDLTKPLSDVEKITQKMGISIRETASEFKSFEDIISTIAPIWEDLSSVDQNAIASVFGGQHKNVFLNLVDSWNEIQDLTKQAEDSSGATATKYNAYLESIEGKTAKLSTATKELWNNLVPDSTVGNITDATSSLIQFVDEYEVLQNIIKSAAVYGLAKGFISAKTSITGAIGSVKNLSTAFSQLEAVQKSTFGTKAYDTAVQNLGDTISTLSDKQIQLVLSTKKLSQNQKIAILEASGLEKAEIQTKLSTLGLSKAQEAAEKSTFNLKGGMSALWHTIKANPVGVLTTAFMLVSTAISVYKQKEEEAKQKAEELRQKTLENAEAVKEEADKISDLISQYTEYKDITSLTAEDKENLKSIQDQLIETFGKEAEGIDLVNGKYDEQIQKLDEVARKKLKQAEDTLISNRNSATKDLHKDNSNIVFEESYVSDELVNLINEAYPGMISAEIKDKIVGGETIEVELYGLTDAQQKIEAIQKVLDKMKDAGYDDIPLFTSLTAKRDEYQENLDAYNKSISDLADNYISLYSLDNPIDMSKASHETYQSWKDGLLKQFEDDKELQSEIESHLEQQLSNGFQGIIPALSNTGVQAINVSAAEKSLSDYSETVKNFIAEKEKLDKAMTEQAENGYISESTAIDLVDSGYSSGVKYDEQTKSYNLLADAINKVSEAKNQDTIETLKNEQANISVYESNLKAQYDEIEKKKSTISNAGDAEYYQNQQAEITETITALDNLNNSYGIYIASLESSISTVGSVSDGFSDITDKIQKYNNELDNLDSTKNILSTAQKEQEENGRLTASTIKALTDAGYANALSYNELTGETTLLTDSINALTKAQIANQKVDLLKTLSETKSKLEDINEEYNELYSKEMSNYKVQRLTQLYEEKGEYEEAVAELQTELMMLDAYAPELQIGVSVTQSAEDAVEEYINSIKETFDKEKSDLDHLLNMDVISQEEYYNRLFDLNEKYFKGKTELLDEYRQYEEEVYKGLKETQIKAIQEQIDALKSVNEEKQEEIDLEKAKQALENAKRQKTISVYDSERGWIRETDRNAIDSAQKEYDDLVLNEQVETLENLIDAIENGTNTSHQLDESVNAVEQVNSITGQQFIENVMQTFANKGLDFSTMFNINGLTNGAEVYNSIMQGKINPVSSDSYTTNNKTMNVNIDKVIADDPVRFTQQMEQIADERFKENFPPAMNQFGRDLKRYQMNHSN